MATRHTHVTSSHWKRASSIHKSCHDRFSSSPTAIRSFACKHNDNYRPLCWLSSGKTCSHAPSFEDSILAKYGLNVDPAGSAAASGEWQRGVLWWAIRPEWDMGLVRQHVAPSHGRWTNQLILFLNLATRVTDDSSLKDWQEYIL